MAVKPKVVVQYDSDDSDSEKSMDNSEQESEEEEKDDFQFSDEDDASDVNEDANVEDENHVVMEDEEDSEEDEDDIEEDNTDSNKESDDDESMDVEDDDDCDGNKGWADSIAKILNTKKPAKKKSLVLSKAKLLADIKIDKPKPKSAGFEIVKEDGDVAEVKIEEKVKSVKIRKDDSAKIMKLSIKGLRKIPHALDRPRERALSKIATKGVVQLFNAVRNQQKEIKDKLEQAGPMESKKEKAMMSIDRGAFLDRLKKDKSVVVDNLGAMKSLGAKKHMKEVEKDDSTWSVLQPNFRMGANIKNWDKKCEVEEELEEEIEFA